MGIDVHRDVHLLVPQPLGNYVHRNTRLQKQRSAGMPHPMELDSSDAGGFDDLVELSLADVVHLKRIPERVNLAGQLPPLLRKD